MFARIRRNGYNFGYSPHMRNRLRSEACNANPFLRVRLCLMARKPIAALRTPSVESDSAEVNPLPDAVPAHGIAQANPQGNRRILDYGPEQNDGERTWTVSVTA